MLSVEIVRTSEQLERLRREWDALLDRCRPHAVFLTSEWMLAWWEVYGEGGGLFLVAVREGNRLIGLLPTLITGPAARPGDPFPRQLRLLGSTAVCSDHLDGLAEAGYEGRVVAAWQSAIKEHQGEWDSLEFADLDPEGLLCGAIRRGPDLWGETLRWTERLEESCPFISLPASWDVFLAGLSAKTRREIRHDRRTLEDVAKVAVRAVTDTDRLEEAMASFMRLHQMRRESLGEQGSFADERYERFHLLVSRRFAERGWLRLWLLDADGGTVAARYQFAYRGRVHDYLPGHDPRWHKYSVGLILLSHCVEQAILKGDREVDLLRGAEGYKSRWANRARGQVTVTASRRYTGAWVHHATTEGARRLRQAAKVILPEAVVQMVRGAQRNKQGSVKQATDTRFVPFFPSTATRDLWGPRWAKPRPFPLDDPRTAFYYFARNGIWHAIDLLGLTQNDEVLMPAYNNGMEVAPFQHRGIPLRYVHVDRQMGLDLKDLTEKITARTRMVYVIHYLGFSQPMDEIETLCRDRGLLLFEDCALAFGSSVNGRPLGSFGDVAIFCLAKFLPVPNGGVLVLNDPKLVMPPATIPPSRYSVASQLTSKLLEHMKTHGNPWACRVQSSVTLTARRLVRLAGLRRVDSGVMQFLPDKVDWGMAPVSGRILERVDYETLYGKRRENYLALLEMVRGIRGVTLLQPTLPDGVCPLFLPVLVEDNQQVCNALIERGICAGGFWNWFPPGVPVEEFPDTAFLRKHVLELQVHQDLEPEHLEATAYHLREVMRGIR